MSDPDEVTVASDLNATRSDGDEAYCAACNQSFTLEHMFCPNDGSRLVKLMARPDEMLGRVFDDRYEVRAVIGHGGMGIVYRGWQLSVDREVAIKVIHPKLATVRDVAKRFLREARLSSRLSESTIVNTFDFGQTADGILYIVMELLRGRPLSRELEGGRALPLRRVTAIAMQICEALEAAHGLGIVHRDLKPQNVVLLEDALGRDRLKILDFGLAKSLVNDQTSLVTQTDALLGTPLYMPPEQILGRPSDQRADIYSLGCMLYQMVSGRPPFAGANLNVVLGMQIRETPAALPDTVPRRLAALITRMMAKSPEDRPPSVAIVHATLAAIAEGAPPLPHEVVPAASPDPVRRRRVRWALAAAVVVGAGGGLVATLASRSRSPDAPAVAPVVVPAGAAIVDAGARPAATSDAALVVAPVADAGPVIPADAPRAHVVSTHAHRDAGSVRQAADDAAPRRPVDAGLPDIDLLPTKH